MVRRALAGISVRQRKQARATARQSLPRTMRLALTVVALLAFTFQSYVTQTHIHVAGRTGIETSMLGGDAKSSATHKTDKFPANQDPSNCPICQEILHSGSFVTPSAIAALPPALAVSVVVVRLEAAIAHQPVSHSWRGRAPPHI
jgi:hypothetical protein